MWKPLPGEEPFKYDGQTFTYVRNTETGQTGYYCRQTDLVYRDFRQANGLAGVV